MHLKNFSLLHSDNGVCLSPAYDLLNVNLLNPADDEELALTLNAKKKKITIKDFEILGNSLQIAEKAWRNSMTKFASMNNEVNSMIDASFLGLQEKEQYNKIWSGKQTILTNK